MDEITYDARQLSHGAKTTIAWIAGIIAGVIVAGLGQRRDDATIG